MAIESTLRSGVVLEIDPTPWYETVLIYGGAIAVLLLVLVLLALYYRAFRPERRTGAER